MKKRDKKGKFTSLEKQMKNIIKWTGMLVLITGTLLFAYQYGKAEMVDPDAIIETVIQIQKEQPELKYRTTSYYPDDPTGSGITTGSGLSIYDFEINPKGWYTYEGKIVLAGATNECLDATSGACGRWTKNITGRNYFNYYDEVKITILDVEYDGIILDSCGACMYVAENRIDIYVVNKYHEVRDYDKLEQATIKLGE